MSVRSATDGISFGVPTAATKAPRWADLDDDGSDSEHHEVIVDSFENGAQRDDECEVDEAVAQVVLSDGPTLRISDRADEAREDGVEAMISTPAASVRSKVDVTSEVAGFSGGSERHMLGTCKPCAFFHLPEGCHSGAQCEYCHRCPPREKQRRKRLRRRLLREQEERTSQDLVYDQEMRCQRRHFRQCSTGSNYSTGSWESVSTWESGSTVDSAEYMVGTSSCQSSASGAGSSCSLAQVTNAGSVMQPMVHMGFMQAIVPVYGVQQGFEVPLAAGCEPGGGSSTPYACAQQQTSMAYSLNCPPPGCTLVPFPHSLQPHQVQHLPTVIRHHGCVPQLTPCISMPSLPVARPVPTSSMYRVCGRGSGRGGGLVSNVRGGRGGVRQVTARLSGSSRTGAISSSAFPRQDPIAEMQFEDELSASEDEDHEEPSGFFGEEDDDNDDDDDDGDEAAEVESPREYR